MHPFMSFEVVSWGKEKQARHKGAPYCWGARTVGFHPKVHSTHKKNDPIQSQTYPLFKTTQHVRPSKLLEICTRSQCKHSQKPFLLLVRPQNKTNTQTKSLFSRPFSLIICEVAVWGQGEQDPGAHCWVRPKQWIRPATKSNTNKTLLQNNYTPRFIITNKPLRNISKVVNKHFHQANLRF